MLQGWIDRVVVPPHSPTADLYFVNAAGSDGCQNVRRIAPTVFAAPCGTLVMRHAGRVADLPPGPVVYLIDDDIPSGVADPGLPRLYRRKLAMLEAPCWRRLVDRADHVVAASATLAGRLEEERGSPVKVMSPYWSEPFATLDHHDNGQVIDIAYLGSAVHRADLKFLLPVFEALLAADRRVRIHLAQRHLLPSTLARNPRVLRLAGRGWGAYRAAACGRRFHIALYPLLDSPFNRARSLNKLIEHAICGAAPIYSNGWPEARRVVDGASGLVRPNLPQAWIDAALYLIRDDGARGRIASGAQALGRELNDPAPQRRLWGALLGARFATDSRTAEGV